jgi:hypothetical protein
MKVFHAVSRSVRAKISIMGVDEYLSCGTLDIDAIVLCRFLKQFSGLNRFRRNLQPHNEGTQCCNGRSHPAHLEQLKRLSLRSLQVMMGNDQHKQGLIRCEWFQAVTPQFTPTIYLPVQSRRSAAQSYARLSDWIQCGKAQFQRRLPCGLRFRAVLDLSSGSSSAAVPTFIHVADISRQAQH